jgi:hypothetical protein
MWMRLAEVAILGLAVRSMDGKFATVDWFRAFRPHKDQAGRSCIEKNRAGEALGLNPANKAEP